jgi:hypothetical protein
MVVGQSLKAAGDRTQMRRFVLLALLLPPVIVAIDHVTWMGTQTAHRFDPKAWFYAWLVVKTALVTWLTGRQLGNTLYGWLLLAWGLALLDLNTLVRVEDHGGLASSVVASQASLLVVWAILGEGLAAWRIAAAMVAATLIIFHASLFDENWSFEGMPILQSLAVVILAGLCLAMRRLGVRLRRAEAHHSAIPASSNLAFQFGVKHMLVWMTALAPLLMVLVGLNWEILRQLTWRDAMPAALGSVTSAVVGLATTWLVLGERYLVLRLALAAPAIFAASWAMNRQAPPQFGAWPNELMLRLVHRFHYDELWHAWFLLLSGLLAAMLLFLRADGYRLKRVKGATS